MEEAGDAGILAYTQVLTAEDTSTVIEVGNSLNGIFQRSVTGTTNGTLIETGTDRGTPFEIPNVISTVYGITETGNLVSGALRLTESGSADRYSLPGTVQQHQQPPSAVTAPATCRLFADLRAPSQSAARSTALTGGNSYPGKQSSAAEEEDPFAQAGLDLLHEYCFAAGTLVLTKTGPKPIEQIQPGELVLSVDDQNPDGPAEWKPVEQVYHNAPAELLNVHVSGSRLPSGTLQGTGPEFPPLGRGGQGSSPGTDAGAQSRCRPAHNADARAPESSAPPSTTRSTSSAKAGSPPPNSKSATACAHPRAKPSP